jgi:hypothetical protein
MDLRFQPFSSASSTPATLANFNEPSLRRKILCKCETLPRSLRNFSCSFFSKKAVH